MIPFFKATACGNDYVYVDMRDCPIGEEGCSPRSKSAANYRSETENCSENTFFELKKSQKSAVFDQKNAKKTPFFAKIVEILSQLEGENLHKYSFFMHKKSPSKASEKEKKSFSQGKAECSKKAETRFEEAAKISDRHFGVGSDGVVIIARSRVADARMIIFNSDGSRARMCGNALRCVAAYLAKTSQSNYFTVQTDSGVKKVFSKKSKNSRFSYDSSVCIGKAESKKVPEKAENFLRERLKDNLLFVSQKDVGNPHLVVALKSEIDDYARVGELLQTKDFFEDGINVHFCVLGENEIKVKHFERGAGVTLSCGTGAVAVASAFIQKTFFSEAEKINISPPGGKIFVLSHAGNYFLSGKISFVFDGVYYEEEEEND